MITFEKCKYFKGELEVPADKSITHRAIIFSSMADGVSVIENPLSSRDTIATMDAMRALGVEILHEHETLLIHSDGYKNFKEPENIINCENSGTTARLLAGVLAPRKIYATLTGDASLRKRPMARVIKPLSQMGASIRARNEDKLLPLTVLPSQMQPKDLVAEVKSAQVKSAILLAQAQLDGKSSYMEKVKTRNHTEKMLQAVGADIKIDGDKITIAGGKDFESLRMKVAGDFSSAAFFIAAGIVFEGSEILIKSCGLNETRIGFLKALEDLGVKINYEITSNEVEPIGDIYIKSAAIKGGKIEGEIIANLIDEVPLLAFLGLFSENGVEIRDAKELRVKESDRISSIVENFLALGAKVEEFEDGLKVYPLKSEPKKAHLKSFDDHRICMINILLAKKFGVGVLLDDITAIDVSFPDFIGKVADLQVL